LGRAPQGAGFRVGAGITLANKDALADSLRSVAANSDDARHLGKNGHGDGYILRFTLAIENRSASVLKVWILRNDEDFLG